MATARVHPPEVETLESLAESTEAMFAIDGTDRIILWNQACEQLFGYAAESVMGKPCHVVISGDDLHENLHCYPNCPVIYQTRRMPGKPLGEFPMCARTAWGDRKVLYVSTVLVRAHYPAPPTIVHVLREKPAQQAVDERPRNDQIRLTPREREILDCLAQGKATFAIAREFAISATTVRNHVQSILQKLNVHTKFAAVAKAYQEGLIERAES